MVDSLLFTNLNTKQELRMDMYDADYLLYEGGIDWGTIDINHNTSKYPLQVGEDILNTVFGTRDVSISGWIVGPTEERIFQKKEILSKAVNPSDEVKITVGDYCITGRPQTNVRFSYTWQENNEKMCKFLIEIFCPFPLFQGVADNITALSEIIPLWHFDWIIPQEGIPLSVKKQSLFTDVINNGTVAVGCEIEIAASGTANNPAIINVYTQEFIRINKTLEAGETVVFTSRGNKNVYGIIDGTKVSYLDYFDFDSTWLTVRPGINVFTFRTYDENGEPDDTYKNLDISLKYNPCFLNLREE